MRILIGSDDAQGPALQRALAVEHLVCDRADSLTETGSIAQHNGPYDLVLIATTAEPRRALTTLRELRNRGLRTPIVLQCPRLTAEEEQAALELGADDVLPRAVGPSLLAARLHAVARRALGHATPVMACANLVLDQARRAVTVEGRPVHLTAREFDVLEVLMLRRGALLTKEALLSRLYGNEEGPDPRIVDVFVCKLRRKLAAAGAPELIRTAWGSGYVLEEPSHAAVAAARARFAAGQPRPKRLHLALAQEERGGAAACR